MFVGQQLISEDFVCVHQPALCPPQRCTFYQPVLCCSHFQSNVHSTDRGSGLTGEEVGGSIDEALNEVIGRINGDLWGTMSISACPSV